MILLPELSYQLPPSEIVIWVVFANIESYRGLSYPFLNDLSNYESIFQWINRLCNPLLCNSLDEFILFRATNIWQSKF